MSKEIEDFNKAFDAIMAIIPVSEEVDVVRIKYGEQFHGRTTPNEPLSPNYWRTLCLDMKDSIVGMSEMRIKK